MLTGIKYGESERTGKTVYYFDYVKRPGHASFFYSPDGSELWCAYHGLKQTNPSVTYAPRYLNLQKVNFDRNGYLVMGAPTGYETDIPYLSGEAED